ncbi:MAG: magnesium/cobalt transporter CorA [Phocaeicola sp.]
MATKSGRKIGNKRKLTTKNNLLSEQLKYTGQREVKTHMHLQTYNAQGVDTVESDKFAELKKHFRSDRMNWLQVHGLQDTETIRLVCEHFHIGFLTMQDILNVNHLTKIEEHDRYNLLIMKLLNRTEKEGDYEPQQVCLVQGSNFVITFSECDTEFFNDVSNAIENNILKIRARTSDFLFSVLLNNVMASFMSIISHIEDTLEEMSDTLLSERDRDKVGIEDIQFYRRQYFLIKKTIQPLKEQYNKLLRTENGLIHTTHLPYYNDVYDHLQFVIQTMEACRESFTSLIELYISNNDLRMNNIMKQLTVVSAIFIPLTFLAGIWGMNFKWIPELEWQYGYYYAWAMMFVTGLVVYIYFKRKKWY